MKITGITGMCVKGYFQHFQFLIHEYCYGLLSFIFVSVTIIYISHKPEYSSSFSYVAAICDF